MKPEIKNLSKRLDGIARKPEQQAACEEGYKEAVYKFMNGLRLLPIPIQVIEALKRSKVTKASPFHPERVAANARSFSER